MWTYLFTFWPPGPLLLLKLTSVNRFGIVSPSNLESHWRVADISSSLGSEMVDESRVGWKEIDIGRSGGLIWRSGRVGCWIEEGRGSSLSMFDNLSGKWLE